jgi:hypothetical protein
MAFQKVGSGKFKFIKYKDAEEGQILAEGTYLGTRQGQYGIQHQVKEDSGDITVLNSAGHLNFLLENHVSRGDYIQVTYAGVETLEKGKFKGKEVHKFEVGVDPERSTDGGSVAPVSTSASAADDDETDEDDAPAPKRAPKAAAAVETDEDDEDLGEDDDEEEEAAAPTPAPAVAAKKRMSSEELLAKYRKPAKGA